ncbi:MAG: hypothetical protein R3E79_12625 [Caldilineaceae bacterium]
MNHRLTPLAVTASSQTPTEPQTSIARHLAWLEGKENKVYQQNNTLNNNSDSSQQSMVHAYWVIQDRAWFLLSVMYYPTEPIGKQERFV